MKDEQPAMHVVDGRPLNVKTGLSSIDGTYVHCRLPGGTTRTYH